METHHDPPYTQIYIFSIKNDSTSKYNIIFIIIFIPPANDRVSITNYWHFF